MSDNWTVKVCDLGTARFCNIVEGHLVSAAPGLMRDMTRGVGTLLWTAPEVTVITACHIVGSERKQLWAKCGCLQVF